MPTDKFERRLLIERITAAVWVVISIVLVWKSIDYGLFVLGAPGPGLFPALTAGALGLTSLVWLVTGGVVREQVPATDSDEVEGRAPRAEAETVTDAEDVSGTEAVADLEEATDQDTGMAHDDTAIDRDGARLIAFCVAWSLVVILLIRPLGYILTVTLYVGGMLVVIAKVTWWRALVGSLVGAMVTYWLAGLLDIALPRDPWGLFRALGL